MCGWWRIARVQMCATAATVGQLKTKLKASNLRLAKMAFCTHLRGAFWIGETANSL